MSKNVLSKTSASVRKCMRVYASREGGVPYNNTPTPSTPTPWALEHSPRAQGPVADIYIYIYTCAVEDDDNDDEDEDDDDDDDGDVDVGHDVEDDHMS